MKQILSVAVLLLFTVNFTFSQVLENAFIVEDKARKAQTIIEGKIISKHSYFTEGNKAILTDYEIEVHKVFKGNITGETITITDFGGQVGNTSVSTPCHRSNLIVGQTAIYFCGASKWNESSATNQTFSLASSQIIFNKNAHDAIFDKKQTYPSREYVYNAIKKVARTDFQQRKLNHFELQAEDWKRVIEQNLQARSGGGEVLEYNLRNLNVQLPIVEFDVTVKANEPNLRFGEGEIHLKYSPQIFGNNVVLNSNIAVVKEALILSNDYSLTINDYSADELLIDIELGTNPVNLGLLSTSEQKLCHIAVNLSNVNNSGMVEFEDLNMQSKSSHYDINTNALDVFEIILTGDELNYVFTDFNFSPSVITAGTKSILTITAAGGTDFGTIKGNVKMRDANHSNLGNINAMYEIEDQFVTWTPNMITVVLPSLSTASGVAMTPGSGPIQIEKVNASGSVTTTFTSASQINVFYAITNADDGIGFNATFDAIVNQTALDTTEGVTFYLGRVLDSIPNVREIIEESLCLWKEKTGVNFNLSDSVIANAVADVSDGLNVIYMMPDSVPGFEMQTTLSYSTISLVPPLVPSKRRYAWSTDIDIQIKRYTNLSPAIYKNWNYTNNPPAANEEDFYAAIIHEFGHAHSLNHIIGMSPDTLDGRLMFPLRINGENISKRSIDTTAIAGGIFVLQHSVDALTALAAFLGSAAPTPMTRILNFDCITSTNELVENTIEVQLYPNPVNNQFNIKYELLQPSEVVLEIYDVTGREIQRENLGFQTTGAYLRQLEFSHPTGVYFVRLRTEHGFKALKVVKH